MKHRPIVLSISGKRLHFYVRWALLCMFIIPTVLMCVNTETSNQQNIESAQAINKADSLKQKLLNDFRNYKLKKQTGLFSGNWLDLDAGLIKHIDYSEFTDNELVDVTKELYYNYYMKKIELYNYKGYAYLYLDIKEAQSNKGAFQVSIPLPNFIEIFRNKIRLED